MFSVAATGNGFPGRGESSVGGLRRRAGQGFCGFGEWKESSGTGAAVYDWEESEQRQAENRSGGFGGGRARQAGGERTFSDGSAAYLRGGRCDWISGAGEHFDGAGAAGGLSHVRQAQPVTAESDSVWHLHYSGNFDGDR